MNRYRKLLKYCPSFLAIFFVSCYPSPKLAGQFTDEEFEKMATNMAKGKVDDIEVDQLKVLEEEDYILLDTREKEEYMISHIPGSIWVGYDDFNVDRIKDLDPSKKIITYCSVGYRSERIGEKIQKAGFENVQNLKGSIFKWKNEGNKIVDARGRETEEIHGFNEKWGKWIKKGDVVY